MPEQLAKQIVLTYNSHLSREDIVHLINGIRHPDSSSDNSQTPNQSIETDSSQSSQATEENQTHGDDSNKTSTSKYYRPIAWSIAAIDMSSLDGIITRLQTLATTLSNAMALDKNYNIRPFRTRIHDAYLISQKFNADIQGKIDVYFEDYVDLADFIAKLYEQLQTVLSLLSMPQISYQDDSYLSLLSQAKEQSIDIWCAITGLDRHVVSIFGGSAAVVTPRVERVNIDSKEARKQKQIISPISQESENQISKAVLASRVQSLAGDEGANLDRAYGISIYLPLGRKDTGIDNYTNALQFSNNVPQWANLIELLRNNQSSNMSSASSIAPQADLQMGINRQRNPRLVSKK